MTAPAGRAAVVQPTLGGAIVYGVGGVVVGGAAAVVGPWALGAAALTQGAVFTTAAVTGLLGAVYGGAQPGPAPLPTVALPPDVEPAEPDDDDGAPDLPGPRRRARNRGAVGPLPTQQLTTLAGRARTAIQEATAIDADYAVRVRREGFPFVVTLQADVREATALAVPGLRSTANRLAEANELLRTIPLHITAYRDAFTVGFRAILVRRIDASLQHIADLAVLVSVLQQQGRDRFAGRANDLTQLRGTIAALAFDALDAASDRAEQIAAQVAQHEVTHELAALGALHQPTLASAIGHFGVAPIRALLTGPAAIPAPRHDPVLAYMVANHAAVLLIVNAGYSPTALDRLAAAAPAPSATVLAALPHFLTEAVPVMNTVVLIPAGGTALGNNALLVSIAWAHFLQPHTYRHATGPVLRARTEPTSFWPAGTTGPQVLGYLQAAINGRTDLAAIRADIQAHRSRVATQEDVVIGVVGTSRCLIEVVNGHVRLTQFYLRGIGGVPLFSVAEVNLMGRLLDA